MGGGILILLPVDCQSSQDKGAESHYIVQLEIWLKEIIGSPR